MFAWYPVVGADPWSPGHLIAADVGTEQMKYSYDGGQSWYVDSELTSLMTEGGIYRFQSGQFPMASTIGFDPHARCHVLVGTVQNGIFRSTDSGRSWKRIKNSTRVTNVSSFYFPTKGQIYVSTYGRGLWKLRVSRPNPSRCTRFVTIPGRVWPPSIWDLLEHIERPFKWPPDVPGWCPQCTYVVIKHGQVTDLQQSDQGVRGFTMTGGFAAQFDARGNAIDLQIPNQYAPGAPSPELGKSLAGLRGKRPVPPVVRGLVLEGQKLRGLIASDSELPVDAGPAPAVEARTRFSSGGMALVEGGEPITLYGTGFDESTERGEEVIITVDGMVVAREMRTLRGRLQATIRLDHVPGPREIVVEQRLGKRLTRVTTTVLVVPADTSEEEEPER
jgi:antitoxin (DNA-binding transcriptional repressor) of toxin-antitoxin stability system